MPGTSVTALGRAGCRRLQSALFHVVVFGIMVAEADAPSPARGTGIALSGAVGFGHRKIVFKSEQVQDHEQARRRYK